MSVLLLLIQCVTGCGIYKANKVPESKTVTTEPINSSENISDNQAPSLSEVMNRILASQELDQAVDYESGKQNT